MQEQKNQKNNSMKNIKNFDKFINEELHPDTYISAAEKLKKKGHRERSEELIDWSNKPKGEVESIELNIGDLTFTLDKNSVLKSNFDEEIHLFIPFDKQLYDDLDGNVGAIWDRTSKEDKIEWVNSIKDLDIALADSDWDSLTEDDKEAFTEWTEMGTYGIGLYFDNGEYRDSDGVVLPNRREAVKFLRFIKSYGKSVDGELGRMISKMTVNDIQFD